MLRYRFTTVPVLNEVAGKYEGTLANDDLLREVYSHPASTIMEVGNKPLKSVTRRRDYGAVRADADMEDLLATAAIQNFVPVVDDTGASRCSACFPACGSPVHRQNIARQSE